jgi:hypothetical protein
MSEKETEELIKLFEMLEEVTELLNKVDGD